MNCVRGRSAYSGHFKKLEVAAGLEPAKTGFADQRLGLFGIATKSVYPRSIPKPVPKLPF
jgi:hypothetical protein